MRSRFFWSAFALAATLLMSGCSGGGGESANNGTTTGTTGTAEPKVETPDLSHLSGKVAYDGSSTVYPISEAMGEEFGTATKDKVEVTGSQSGTGGGFKKFVAGEIDIANASRPISKEEIEQATKAGIEYIEIPVAFDGLTVAIHPENDWAAEMTGEQLKKIWEPGSKVVNWSDVNPAWPKEKIQLFSPGQDSGTFEYFTEAIVEQKKKSRTDVQFSEDDNVLLSGVAGSKFGLGYFGYAYYAANQGKVKAVKVNGVEPSPATVMDGSYSPLSRPLFIYVKKASMERPEVKAFVEFYLAATNKKLIEEAGYVALPDEAYDAIRKHATEMKTGSLFQDVKPGMKISEVLARETAK